MIKILLLSRNKRLMFFLEASTDYNIDSVHRKKASELCFCSRLKKYILIFSTLEFVFKITRPSIFSAVKEVFC